MKILSLKSKEDFARLNILPYLAVYLLLGVEDAVLCEFTRLMISAHVRELHSISTPLKA